MVLAGDDDDVALFSNSTMIRAETFSARGNHCHSPLFANVMNSGLHRRYSIYIYIRNLDWAGQYYK